MTTNKKATATQEQDGERTKQKRIIWTQDEWNSVFDELLTDRMQKARATNTQPHDLATYHSDPGRLTPIEVHRAAARVIPLDRARDIHTSAGLFTPPMLKAFALWQEKLALRRAHNALPSSMKPVQVEPESESESAVEVPYVLQRMTQDQTERPPIRREREKHEWNDDQWQAVCDLLMQRMPLTMGSSTLVGVKLKDIESAARTLWPDDPIPNFAVATARSLLLECVVRARATKAAQPEPAVSPIQALMKAFVEELVKGMAPTLAQMEARIVERVRNDVTNTMRDSMSHVGGTERRVAETVRCSKIAVVGGYNKPQVLEQALKDKFPQFRFIMLGRDPHNFADTIKQCDLVLCNIEGISHSTARGVKTAARDGAFKQVTGGESSVIRYVETYVKSNSVAN